MANIEVDQGQAEAAFRAQRLLNTLLEDPKHGMSVKRIVKDKYPDANIPDLNIIDQVTKPYDEKILAIEAQNAALQTAFNEYRQANEVKEAEGSLRKSLDQVRDTYGFTDEGMQQVVETMRDRNLAHDPEAAAALVQSKMPKPKPTSVRSSLLAPDVDIYGMQGEKDTLAKYEVLHSDPWRFFNSEVIACLDEAAA